MSKSRDQHTKQTMKTKAMRAQRPLQLAFVAITALALLACSTTSAKGTPITPSKTEAIQGSSIKKVTLTESAVQRLAIETAQVVEEPFGPRGEPGPRKIVPASSVIYDLTGGTWVFTNPTPLAYVREPIVIDYVQLDTSKPLDFALYRYLGSRQKLMKAR